MANVKITELPEDTTLADGSEIEIASLSGGVYTSKRTRLSTLASYVVAKLNALLDAAPLTIARGGTGAANARAAAGAIRAPYILAQSATAASVTGTTAETALATITIPANAMGPSGQIEVLGLISFTPNANVKTLRVKFGGIDHYIFPVTASGVLQFIVRVSNRSTSSQVGAVTPAGGFGISTGPIVTSAIDTTAPVPLTITGQLANAADTITLESDRVLLSYGA